MADTEEPKLGTIRNHGFDADGFIGQVELTQFPNSSYKEARRPNKWDIVSHPSQGVASMKFKLVDEMPGLLVLSAIVTAFAATGHEMYRLPIWAQIVFIGIAALQVVAA